MSPEDCLEAIRQFKVKLTSERDPVIFTLSLEALFDTGQFDIRSARLCRRCGGYGVTRAGACWECGVLGYVVKARPKVPDTAEVSCGQCCETQ